MTYTAELKELARELKSGVRYCELMPKVCVQEDIWSTVLSYGYGNNGGGPYWFWRHYGSSAEDATLDGLKFVIETIFGMTVEEFKQKYKPVKDDEVQYRKEFEEQIIMNYKGYQIVREELV